MVERKKRGSERTEEKKERKKEQVERERRKVKRTGFPEQLMYWQAQKYNREAMLTTHLIVRS